MLLFLSLMLHMSRNFWSRFVSRDLCYKAERCRDGPDTQVEAKKQFLFKSSRSSQVVLLGLLLRCRQDAEVEVLWCKLFGKARKSSIASF